MNDHLSVEQKAMLAQSDQPTLRELEQRATEDVVPSLRRPLWTDAQGRIWGSDGDELDTVENADLIAQTLNAAPLYFALEDAARALMDTPLTTLLADDDIEQFDAFVEKRDALIDALAALDAHLRGEQ